jgi:thiamine pyrophosphate-dependent acetolactate synthase large subunit-like protein
MDNMTGGQLVARMLKNQGVARIFTLSGLHVAGIYAGCVEEGIGVVDTRHEQAAAHAADAHARLTRDIGVAVVTAGPGVTDAITGVANAYSAGSPLLLIGGAAPTFNQSRGSLQEIEQVDLFHHITKWADRIPSAELIPSYFAKAFRVALSGKPGPVFLEIAWDILSAVVDPPDLPTDYFSRARPAGDPDFIGRAAHALSAAERPAVIAGSSVWWDDASGPLARLAEQAQVPVYVNGAGRGSLAPNHPHLFSSTRKKALSEADVVLVLGTPLDFRLGYGDLFASEATVIQVDIDPAEIGRNRGAQVGIWADTRMALLGLCEALEPTPPDRTEYLSSLRAAEDAKREALAVTAASDAQPIHHLRLAREIDRVANGPGRDPLFVADGGNYVAMAAKIIELPGPGRWLDPGPLGCLGVGAPFALAAKLEHPERDIVVLQGDGSFGFNGMDFETAVRFDLPMVIVVGNDAAWGQIRLPQLALYGEDQSPATALAPTRYDQIVVAMGGHGELVTDPADIVPALERAFDSKKVACVNVMLDPEAPLKAGMVGYAV